MARRSPLPSPFVNFSFHTTHHTLHSYLPIIRPRLVSRRASHDVFAASTSATRQVTTTTSARAPPSSSATRLHSQHPEQGHQPQASSSWTPYHPSAGPSRPSPQSTEHWPLSYGIGKSSRPLPPPSNDVKGKARALNDPPEFEADSIQSERLDSNRSMLLDAQTALFEHPSVSHSTTTSNPFPQLHFEDRFDWRQTAHQFRRFHLSDLAKPRRVPSAGKIAKSNTRPDELKARIAAYQERLSYLVGLEKDHELAMWEQLRSRSLEELQSEGWAMDGLTGYWQGGNQANPRSSSSKANSVSSKPRIAVFARSGLQKLPWTRFKDGDQVELTPSSSTGMTAADFLPRDDALISSVSDSKKLQTPSQDPETRPSSSERILGTILTSDAYRIRLLFTPPYTTANIDACSSWRIDLAFNDSIYSKIAEVIASLAIDCPGLERSDLGNRLELKGTGLTPWLLPSSQLPSQEQIEQTDEEQRADPLESIFAHDLRIRSWYERYLRSQPLVMEGDPDLSLNESQLKAVALMLSSRLSLVQGPPGTGKTHTLVSAIKLLKHHFAVPHPILLSAHTNVAVDNLVEGALDAGLNVVRVTPARVVSKSKRAESCSLEKKMEQHPLWKKLEEVKMRIGNAKRRMATILERESGGKVDELGNVETGNGAPKISEDVRAELVKLRQAIGKLAQQSFILTNQIQTHVLYSADVVCSTLISSTSAALRSIDFPLVFIDESSQALEHLTLMPLVKGARQIALIGDHKQLPPVLKSRNARKEGGSISLFERLISDGSLERAHLPDADGEAGGSRPLTSISDRSRMQMLQVQHRMHPELAAFPNAQFYQGRLQSAKRTSEIPGIKHSFINENEKTTPRVTFIDHEGQEFIQRSASETSLINSREVSLLFHVLFDLLNSDEKLSGSSIGIITPYLAQSRFISRLLRPVRDRDAHHPVRRALEKRLGGTRMTELEKVEVNTVDGFQGREKDIIIFSSVRCATARRRWRADAAAAERDEEAVVEAATTAPTYNVGFLADERRLNVALTRAKKALFVLGHLETWENGRGLTHGETIDPDNPSKPPAAQDAHALRNFASHVDNEGLVVEESQLLSKIDLGLKHFKQSAPPAIRVPAMQPSATKSNAAAVQQQEQRADEAVEQDQIDEAGDHLADKVIEQEAEQVAGHWADTAVDQWAEQAANQWADTAADSATPLDFGEVFG